MPSCSTRRSRNAFWAECDQREKKFQKKSPEIGSIRNGPKLDCEPLLDTRRSIV